MLNKERFLYYLDVSSNQKFYTFMQSCKWAEHFNT